MPDDHSFGRRSSARLEVDPADLADPRVELTLLGALICDPSLIEKLPPSFNGAHFITDHYRTVFDSLVESGVSQDAGTWLIQNLRGTVPRDLIDGAIAAVGIIDAGYIRDLARLVTDGFQRRQLLRALEIARTDALAGRTVAPIEKIRSGLFGALDALSDQTAGDENGGWTHIGEAAHQALAAADRAAAHGHLLGLACGMPSIDEALGGFAPGTMTILASRPGMGKSALAIKWARAFAERIRQQADGAVLLYSLEMRAEAQARRMLAASAGVPGVDIRRGNHAASARQLLEASNALQELPIYVRDVRTQTVSEMRARARYAKRQFGRVGAIIVDHLHIVAAEEADARRNETEIVTRISQGTARMSEEFDCPVIALCQLSRDVEKRDDKRPKKSDLRQSGQLEQDADNICFLYREEYYLRQEGPPQRGDKTESAYAAKLNEYEDRMRRAAGNAEFIIAKQRDGEEGMISLRFDGALTTFHDPRTN